MTTPTIDTRMIHVTAVFTDGTEQHFDGYTQWSNFIGMPGMFFFCDTDDKYGLYLPPDGVKYVKISPV